MSTGWTLRVRSVEGAVEVPAEARRVVRFGRGGSQRESWVDVRVGSHDVAVSRRHGELTYRDGKWWLRNVGRSQLRLPSNTCFPALGNDDEPIALEVGQTHVHVVGSANREYQISLDVFDDIQPKDRGGARTVLPKQWSLAADERIVLTVMGQQYLRRDPAPRPLTYRETARQLDLLHPEKIWANTWATKRRELPADEYFGRLEKKIQHMLERVRARLSAEGFPETLLRKANEPYDNRLQHNLLKGLTDSATLGRSDLAVIDDEPEASLT